MSVTGLDVISRGAYISPETENARSESKDKSSQNIILPDQPITGQLKEKALITAIEKANLALAGPNNVFKFSIHEGTKAIIVKVINENTGDVIREIPSEKILNMVAEMWELAGLFVDEKV